MTQREHRSRALRSTREHIQALPKSPIRFLLATSKPHAKWAVVTIFFATIAQTLGVVAPYVISRLVDGLTTVTELTDQLSVIADWGILFLCAMLGMHAAWRIAGLTGIRWITKQNATAYGRLYEYIVGHSHGYFINRFAGSLSNKVSNAADGTSRFLERMMWGAYPQIIVSVTIGALLFTIHVFVGAMYVAFYGIIIAYNTYLVSRRRPHVIKYSEASSQLRGEGVDLLSNIQATRHYTSTSLEMKRLWDTILSRRDKDVRQWSLGEYINIINSVAAIVVTALTVGLSYFFLLEGVATVGDVVLAMLTTFRLGNVFVSMGEVMNGGMRLYGEAEEGLEEVFLPHEIVDASDAKKLTVEGGAIAFSNLTFAYDTEYVFKNLNVEIKSGERVGLVGPSGAGKTTLVSLLLRQHHITDGAIMIDGQDITRVTQDSLRANIAVVPQEPLLFHRSIKENIAYGKPRATQKEVERVAQMAEAHHFITALPEGYETLVGERGVKLSGGQKQRIAIARAMLKDAPILLLDEATSALDSESEVAIQRALHELMAGKTVVAIAHRLSTLREMDRILVLENGNVVEDGSHETLAKAGGTYQRLWEHQAGGFLQE